MLNTVFAVYDSVPLTIFKIVRHRNYFHISYRTQDGVWRWGRVMWRKWHKENNIQFWNIYDIIICMCHGVEEEEREHLSFIIYRDLFEYYDAGRVVVFLFLTRDNYYSYLKWKTIGTRLCVDNEVEPNFVWTEPSLKPPNPYKTKKFLYFWKYGI